MFFAKSTARKGERPEREKEKKEMVIDHCDMRDAIERAGMSTADVQEAVMERAGQIVARTLNGKGPGVVHKLAGVELLAAAVAASVIDAGAAKLAQDFELDLGALKAHAASEHVSSC